MLLQKLTKFLIPINHKTQKITCVYVAKRYCAGPLSASSNRNSCDETTAKDSLMEIEENLFANSSNKNDPINMKTLLDKYKKPNRFAKKQATHKNKSPAGADISQSQLIPTAVSSTPIAPVKSKIIHNEELNVSYKKLHLHDPWLQALMLMVKSKKHRFQKHQLLMEGRRLMIDALSAGLELEYLLFSDMDQLKLIKDHLPAETKIIKVPQSDLGFWSTLSTCPGLIGIFVKPNDMETVCKFKNGLPITVICDQIREPNNLGSIIRICAAIPCTQIVVIKGCADPWETKALRGGAGAHFRIPIKGPIEWPSVKSFLPEFYSTFIAENNAHNMPRNTKTAFQLKSYSSIMFDKNIHNVVVIGGETQGVSTDAYEFLQENVFGSCVHIPLADGIESLNTASALAIILFELRKQLTTVTSNDDNVLDNPFTN